MYFKEYGKEFKIRNQVIILSVALFTGALVYYLLPTGKQYAEKIYHVNIYVYLTTTSLFLILYNLKIAEEKIDKNILKLIRYISKNTLVIYLLASITDMMVYARLKEIFPDVTTIYIQPYIKRGKTGYNRKKSRRNTVITMVKKTLNNINNHDTIIM